MRSTPVSTRIAWLAAGLALGVVIGAGARHADAAPRAELQVIPVNKITFGERGAAQYQALVQGLADEGWKYDHAIPGFVVFRR